MADTNFSDLSTLIVSAWLNDINNCVYTGLAGNLTPTSIKAHLHAAPGAIGGTTPASGAFTTLTASGAATVTGALTASSTFSCVGVATFTDVIKVADGTASAPGVTFSADTNTGLTRLAADVLGVATGGATRLRVNASGALKVSPDDTYPDTTATGTQHEINYNGTGFTLFVTNTNASGSGMQGIKVHYTASAPNSTIDQFFQGVDSGGTKINIASNGNITNANNSYGAISDSRLKQDVVTANSQWNDVKNLRLVNYRLKSDMAHGLNKSLIGFVADEVEQISPALVFTDGDGMKGVIYSVAYLKLFGAFQEAQKRIEALEARGKP